MREGRLALLQTAFALLSVAIPARLIIEEDPPMETSVTKKGQTNIPAAIRKRHHIHEGDRLVWLDDGEVIRIVPVPKDPLKALRGAGQGEGLLDRLLQSRREDRERGA
jgi:AbrB family looped-hinge helix DNA binding protein